MAFTWKLNSIHDLSINSEGKFVIVSGAEEIGQRVLVALRHYWREYFLDVPDGIPWYEAILGSKDLKNTELILRRKILEVPGVVGIVGLKVQFDTINTRHVIMDIGIEVQTDDNYVEEVNIYFPMEV